MHILHRFQDAVDRGDYKTALLLIEELTRRHPDMAANWYNYGHCLEQVERYEDAATAFLKAVDCDPNDGGAYFRACLVLDKAKNSARLLSVFRKICQDSPTMLNNLTREFGPYFQQPEFIALHREFGEQ